MIIIGYDANLLIVKFKNAAFYLKPVVFPAKTLDQALYV